VTDHLRSADAEEVF